ncbi:MAG: efflux RND transporter periplasmic adaptor subunit [Burkholderiaceae bacterium]|nr:efflux RND transporter periplasmic adaptor subunit [Burkholderiaceae bacterium]
MSANDINTPLRRRLPSNLKLKTVALLALAFGVVAWGMTTRAKDKDALAVVAQEQTILSVNTTQPVYRNEVEGLTLPGRLEAYYSASVYARVGGYLKHWSVDIGAPVKAGQLLADIETPELDQQLKQSEANLDTAQANERLTEITTRRWQHLLASDSVSQQEADEKGGDYEAKKALVAAARADVERLRALESFKRITAPFDGVVTARKTDIGALINAGHDAGHELFTVGDVHRLRLYVSVPQSYANRVQVGMKAQLEVPEHPGQTFSATLSNNSRAVSENSGTVLVELEVDNAGGKLLPGEYGNVRFDLPPDGHAVLIPASALTFRKEGLSVATLTAENRVAYRAIKISRDLGATVEIASGLTTADHVINNPPDYLESGDLVRVAQSAAGAAAPIKS